MAWMIPLMAQESRRREEDSSLLQAAFQDTKGEWEYKILRGGLGGFTSEQRMRAALEQEARAEWSLFIKLDDERLMLRRPRTARAQDAFRDSDVQPYRTVLRGGTAWLIVMVGILLAVGLTLGLALFAGSSSGLAEGEVPWIVMVLTLGVVVLLPVVMMIKRRR